MARLKIAFSLSVLSLAVVSFISWHWERSFGVSSEILYQGYEPGHEVPYSNINRDGGAFDIEYGFKNFNDDNLAIKVRLDEGTVNSVNNSHGYTDSDLDQLDETMRKAKTEVRRRARELSWSQSELDKAEKSIQQAYETDRLDYLNSRGFKIQEGKFISADIPELVRANMKRFAAVAMEFEGIRQEKNYDFDQLVGAVTSMVQTSMEYRIPQGLMGSLHTGGVLPPLTAFAAGWGDCDTKSAVLSSILVNWDEIYAAGVGLPGHYLMGVQDIPERGQAYVEHDGVSYVLIEAAGPAWMPPGEVAQETLDKLSLSNGVYIEPF